MTTGLRHSITLLEAQLPELEKRRGTSAYANDLYEAVDDWVRLGQRALANDTRVDFPERVRGEKELLQRLEMLKPTNARGSSILQDAKRLLEAVGKIKPPIGGHLGILTAIKTHFTFVQKDFDFSTKNVHPLGLTLISSKVHLNLAYAANHTSPAASALKLSLLATFGSTICFL